MKYCMPIFLTIILFLNAYFASGNLKKYDIDKYYEDGMKKFEEKKFKNAIKNFTEIIVFNPDCLEDYKCHG